MKEFIFILYFPVFLFGQECHLPSGKYKVIPDEKFKYYPEYDLELKKDSAISYENNEAHYYKIIRSYCNYRLESFHPPGESELTELDKILNKEPPYYVITKIDENAYKFIFRPNLHVMIYSGKFIRIEE